MFVNFNILNQLGSPAINSNTFANRPAAGQTGRLFVSTDTFEIYRDNGTTWDLIGGPGSSTITGTGTATQVAYFTSSQAIGSSANLFWDNTNSRLGINTATPGAALDIHGTGTIQQINSTSATANSLLAFQRSGTGLWRIGDNYNAGSNFFELYNTAISTNAIAVLAATNKTEFTAVQTYTSGLARGNYFDYNLSVAAGGSFSTPNAITALGASLDLTLAGNATIPSGSRSGLDAYNTVSFTGAGTLTMTQGTQIRPYSNITAGWAFAGSAVGTITHLAGLRILFPDNSGSTVNVTNNYALLINDQTANTGTVSYTSSRWGIYQEGASDLNYFAANVLIKSTVNNGNALQVTGNGNLTGSITAGSLIKSGGLSTQYLMADGSTSTLTNPVTGTGTTNYIPKFTSSSAIGNSVIYESSSNIGIGTITPSGQFHTYTSAYKQLLLTYPSTFASRLTIGSSEFYIENDASPETTSYVNATGTGTFIWKGGSSATERMRLTSTGLGIGITPAAKLDVSASSGTLFRAEIAGVAQLNIGNGGASINYYDANTQIFRSGNGTERMRLDASGNLGLGVTPSAWFANTLATEIGPLALYSRTDIVNDAGMMLNAYRNASASYIYKQNGFATNYQQGNGSHYWYTATSGTAGNAISFTQAMTLDASGNLALGRTNAFNKLTVKTGSNNNFDLYNDTNGIGIQAINDANTAYRTMQLNASTFALMNGNVGIGTTSPTSISGYTSLDIQNTTNGGLLQLGTNGTGYGQLYNNTSEVQLRSIVSVPLVFGTNGSERMRITSGGELLINTTSDAGDYKLQVNGSAYLANSNTTVLRINGTAGYASALLQAGHLEFYRDASVTKAAAIGFQTPATSISNDMQFALYDGSTWSHRMTLTNAGNLEIISGSIKTAAPSGGTAKPYKWGEAGVAIAASDGLAVKVEIDGVLYYLMTASLP